MAFTEGFFAADTALVVANMNACLLGWGPKADFPAAAAGNKGRVAWATDEELLYYSNGSAWVAWPFVNTLTQNITGIKTFGSIPVLPGSNPTTDNQAARKLYVDGIRKWIDIDSPPLQAGPNGAWTDFDLSGTIPAGATAVLLIYNGGAPVTIGARKNGSARTTTFTVAATSGPLTFLVELDAGRIVEIYANTTGGTFYAMAYCT